MALDFAVHELALYLDTHKDDKDAFDMLKSMLALSTKARKEYERMFGPIDIRDLENADKFTWLSDPWPWEYSERRK
ncbi:MAG: spore coat protein CotJB [Oscillospiraceae bacterium]|nr:spore coat protein CotJB [Oscillospiraceae bacterium]